MTPRERLVRLVNWAFRLSLFTLAVAVFGFGTCQPAVTTVVHSATLMKAGQATRPPPNVLDKEWEDWQASQKPVRDATYDQAGNQMLATTLFVGVPIAVLLIGVCILLYRVRVWLRRGA
jgi:hypothetical protein